MNAKVWMVLALIAAPVFAQVPAPPNSLHIVGTPAVWISPRSGGAYAADFFNLFNAAGQWPMVKANATALEVSIQFATTGATDGQFTAMLTALAGDHIGLGVDFLPLSGVNGCGMNVEGYAAPAQVPWLVARLKRLGAVPLYFGMDEPLWYGHIYTGASACQATTSTLIADIASKVADIRSVFPAAAIGETEPLGAVMALDPVDRTLPNFTAWLDAFKSATGTPLAYFRLDMDWTAAWQPFLAPVAQLLKSRGIQFQVIYDGQGNAASAAVWAAQVLANARAVEAIAAPDVAMFQSWSAYPTLAEPETNATTFTGIVKNYLATRAH